MAKQPGSAIVIGAGIVGLAIARSLAVRNWRVTVIEKQERALGASVRNFGMIWPIGQPDGELYERASLSRRIWKEICNDAGIWYDKVGSLHLAYAADEWNVLQELANVYSHRNYMLLGADETCAASPATRRQGLMGSLFSPQEMIVDPREAIARIPFFLTERYGVKFIWGKAVTDISLPAVYSGSEQWEADEVFVCSGADFETLFPEVFRQLPITRCKLQMMRTQAQPGQWRMGPALCAGLSLLHYKSFQAASSLSHLKQRIEQEMPEYLKWGIHVMASQNQEGSLTLGDSHEYGWSHDPFDRDYINQLILNYLDSFMQVPDRRIAQSWHGVYPKLTNGATELVIQPERGINIVNALGGAGMTLSFGLAEQVVKAMS
jgi:FAD dependent oxidoreductase TIGR03364